MTPFKVHGYILVTNCQGLSGTFTDLYCMCVSQTIAISEYYMRVKTFIISNSTIDGEVADSYCSIPVQALMCQFEMEFRDQSFGYADPTFHSLY